MRIFFYGDINENWKSGWQRYQTLKQLGCEVIPFSKKVNSHCSLVNRIAAILMGRSAFKEKAIRKFNDDFLSELKEVKYEVVWVEKALLLLPETILLAKKLFPERVFVCFQDDNPFSERGIKEKHLWFYFIKSIPCYDIHLVKRNSDLLKFKQAGAKAVALHTTGFYKGIFHPLTLEGRDSLDLLDVIFVGTNFEKERSDFISDLMRKHKIPLHVFGNKWDRSSVYFQKREYFHPPVNSQDYVNTICKAKISLGLVSSSNEDEYSMRTFEIPACKGFLLAQRTPRHMELYKEGQEAEFFDTSEECADKIHFYLNNDVQRIKIAEAGYRRCMDSDYSLNRRLSETIELIKKYHKKED